MKTKKNGVKRKSRLIGKLKGKKRSKIMRGGSGRGSGNSWRSAPPRQLSIKELFKDKEFPWIIIDRDLKIKLEIYEFTNTGIGILYNKPSEELYGSPITYYYISLFELNVDTMQYALNNNCVNQYKKFPLISFKNFPSLVVSTSMGWSTKSRNSAIFFDVFEDDSNMISYELQKQMFLKDIEDVKENKDEYNYYNLYPYLTNVKLIKADNSIIDIQLGERIQYVKDNAIWLENYFEQNKLKEIKEIPVYPREKYSDLHGLDLIYIIIDEMKIVNEQGVSEDYIILGYPDYKKTKPMILEFLQTELKDIFKIIHKKQNDEFYNLFSELFNLYVNDENKKINLNPVNLKDELYKIFYNDMIGNWDYISNLYIEKEINFDKSLFLKNYNTYFNIIAEKYLNCIISSIKYTFLIYRKEINKENEDKLIPFVFNIKELEPKHKPILKRVQKLIQNEIPNIYKIKEVDDYNKITTYDNPELYDSDKEYKLFYSYHTHGEFFHITTEYLHTMSNLGNMAHTYKNRITLEEIIYSSGLLTNDNIPFWKKLVIKYQVREWNIYFSDFDKNNTRIRQKTLEKSVSNISKQLINTSRSAEAFKQYEESKQIRKDRLTSTLVSKIETIHKNNNLLAQQTETKIILDLRETFLNNESKAQIILMERNSNEHYIFYYKVNNKFYKITLQPNLRDILETDIKYIFTNLQKYKNIISFIDDNSLNTFKVYENIELNPDSLKPVFKYNPLVYYVNNARYNIDNDNIDTSLYYANKILDIRKLISKNIIKSQEYENLYKTTKPWFYRNFLQDNFYLKSKNNYNNNNNSIWNNINNKKCHKEIYYEEKFKGCDKKNCGNDSHINCVYYNINKTGYDIIEIIDNSADKIIIWIIPSNKDNKDTPYLGNILDLNGEQHILLLEAIKNLYENQNMLCFLHNTVNHQYFCLHFHITQNDNYKRKFPKFEFGTYISQDLYINDIIEKLKTNKNYFTNYNNVALIRQQ
jgi:hypothetical protein